MNYKSVTGMVKDLSGVAFEEELKKRIKENTVYVFIDLAEPHNSAVFRTLKAAKEWAEGIFGGKVNEWYSHPRLGEWAFNEFRIFRRKISS